jgi:hypothetical protein
LRGTAVGQCRSGVDSSKADADDATLIENLDLAAVR